MTRTRPKNGTLAWFDSLSKRDFDNGATLDEIAKVYKQRDALLAACKLMLGYGPGEMPDGRDTYDILRDAIAKAEETSS